MEPHQQRVFDEKSDLDGRIDRLTAFVNHSDTYGKLPEAERERLRAQLGVMELYSQILGRRIMAFPT